MSGSGPDTLLEVRKVLMNARKVLPNARKDLPDVREWSGAPPGCPGVVEGPPGCPGVVWMPPGCQGVVGRPSRMSRNGREALPNVRE